MCLINKSLLTCKLLLLIGLSASPVSAELIGIDIGNGGAVPPGWHQIGAFGGSLFDLDDEGGNATDVDVTIDTNEEINTLAINASTLPTHTSSLAGLDDFVAFTGHTIEFSDLMPGAEYNLWIFSVYDVPIESAEFDATITGAGIPQVLSFTVDTSGNLVINGVTGSSTQSLHDFATTATASPAGTIQIVLNETSFTNNDAPFAGVAIEFVPEPNSLLLLGGAGFRGSRWGSAAVESENFTSRHQVTRYLAGESRGAK